MLGGLVEGTSIQTATKKGNDNKPSADRLKKKNQRKRVHVCVRVSVYVHHKTSTIFPIR